MCSPKSSGFCLETLLEAAKFVELQEQQQKQIFVVASGSTKATNESQIGLAPSLSNVKLETEPGAKLVIDPVWSATVAELTTCSSCLPDCSSLSVSSVADSSDPPSNNALCQ
ncbi:hypothetical protein M8J75_005284 [Diaphorina citri]|nr:hypothetical protein M8J75_005284 [Diaphorina citri]